MCRWKRHTREGRLEFEVHSEWMRRTRRIGQMRPADAEGSKARQGVWVWVLGLGSWVRGQPHTAQSVWAEEVGKVDRWGAWASDGDIWTSQTFGYRLGGSRRMYLCTWPGPLIEDVPRRTAQGSIRLDVSRATQQFHFQNLIESIS